MQRGKLEAVKGALVAALANLESADLFNIVVFSHRAESFAAAPVPGQRVETWSRPRPSSTSRTLWG